MVWLRIKMREPAPAPDINWGVAQTAQMILGMVLSAALIYLIAAFVCMDLNPAHWRMDQRMISVVLWAFSAVFVYALVGAMTPSAEDADDDKS